MVVGVSEPFQQTITLIDDLHFVEFDCLTERAWRRSRGEDEQQKPGPEEVSGAHGALVYPQTEPLAPQGEVG